MNQSASLSQDGLVLGRAWSLAALAGIGVYVVIDASLALLDPCQRVAQAGTAADRVDKSGSRHAVAALEDTESDPVAAGTAI